MRFSTSVTAAAVVAANLASASPVARQASLSACANITQQMAQAEGNSTASMFVDGQLAYDCLNTIPFNATLGASFVAEIRKYMQFQSTIPVLKNPPKSYLSQATDLLGGLDAIYQKAYTNQYQSQYQMDTELDSLVRSANDGHLSVNGLCSLNVLAFGIPERYQIVSVSTDGVQLPKLYFSTDARLVANGSQAISDIVLINGEDAVQYLEKIGMGQDNQDPDAQYNRVFASQARYVSSNRSDFGIGAFITDRGRWPGTPSVTFTLRNGTVVSTRVHAFAGGFNYTDGASIYRSFCLPRTSTTSNSPSTSSSTATATSAAASTSSSVLPTATTGPMGYGVPIIRDPYSKIAGYYLNGTFNDTAVLFVPSFSISGPGLPDSEVPDFAAVASTFVNRSVADGKKKIIVDVSGNPGGDIISGFNLFRVFFPDVEVYSATRMRDHPAELLTLKSVTAFNTLNSNQTNGTTLDNVPTNPFVWQNMVTPDQTQDFSSWEALYGPDPINGANMTSLYANFNYTTASSPDSPISGYGPVPNNSTRRPFSPENILILSDGFCQSTCTTFTNLMTDPSFGGARSVATGGRPINAPMQAMGGVRGAQSFEWEDLASNTELAYQLALAAMNTSSPVLTQSELDLFDQVRPRNTFSLKFGGGNLNLRNAYNPRNSVIPLQFSYQPANCKLFYTYENLIVPQSIWTSAANAFWGNGSCVVGSQVMNTTTQYSTPQTA